MCERERVAVAAPLSSLSAFRSAFPAFIHFCHLNLIGYFFDLSSTIHHHIDVQFTSLLWQRVLST